MVLVNGLQHLCIGDNNEIKKISEIKYPHSLGLLYSTFTLYCGFKVNEGETN